MKVENGTASSTRKFSQLHGSLVSHVLTLRRISGTPLVLPAVSFPFYEVLFFGHTESSTCVWSWLEISGACVGLLGQSSHFWYPPNSGVNRNPKKLVERAKLPQIVPLLPAQLRTYASNFLHLSYNSLVHLELDSSFSTCFPPHSGNFLYCRSSLHQFPVSDFSNTFTMAPAVGIDLGTTFSCVAVFRDDRVS